nr:hypothetical protein [Tanacetum cinerariifolium]
MEFSWIHSIGFYSFVVFCELQAQIRHIFLMDTAYKMQNSSARPGVRPKSSLNLTKNENKCYIQQGSFSRQRVLIIREVILFYKGLDVPTRQILDSKGAIPSMKAADAKKAIQDMADHSQK